MASSGFRPFNIGSAYTAPRTANATELKNETDDNCINATLPHKLEIERIERLPVLRKKINTNPNTLKLDAFFEKLNDNLTYLLLNKDTEHLRTVLDALKTDAYATHKNRFFTHLLLFNYNNELDEFIRELKTTFPTLGLSQQEINRIYLEEAGREYNIEFFSVLKLLPDMNTIDATGCSALTRAIFYKRLLKIQFLLNAQLEERTFKREFSAFYYTGGHFLYQYSNKPFTQGSSPYHTPQQNIVGLAYRVGNKKFITQLSALSHVDLSDMVNEHYHSYYAEHDYVYRDSARAYLGSIAERKKTASDKTKELKNFTNKYSHPLSKKIEPILSSKESNTDKIETAFALLDQPQAETKEAPLYVCTHNDNSVLTTLLKLTLLEEAKQNSSHFTRSKIVIDYLLKSSITLLEIVPYSYFTECETALYAFVDHLLTQPNAAKQIEFYLLGITQNLAVLTSLINHLIATEPKSKNQEQDTCDYDITKQIIHLAGNNVKATRPKSKYPWLPIECAAVTKNKALIQTLLQTLPYTQTAVLGVNHNADAVKSLTEARDVTADLIDYFIYIQIILNTYTHSTYSERLILFTKIAIVAENIARYYDQDQELKTKINECIKEFRGLTLFGKTLITERQSTLLSGVVATIDKDPKSIKRMSQQLFEFSQKYTLKTFEETSCLTLKK